MKKIIIAIDGPAGSGKTTSAKIVAEKLNYIYIDTGAMYRAFALLWLKSGKEYKEEVFKELFDSNNINLKHSGNGQRTFINDEDVTDFIRTPEVTKYASLISADKYIRNSMVRLQREMGKNGGVVMDGRDIGTAVFPNSELKIFLIASIETRANRRIKELKIQGIDFDEKEIIHQIIERDNNDSKREVNPLKKAEDAIEIDTSNLSIEEQTNIILNYALKIINNV